MDCPNDRYVNDAAICQAVVGMLARIGVKVNAAGAAQGAVFRQGAEARRLPDLVLPARLDARHVRLPQRAATTSWAAATIRNPAAARPISAATATRSSTNSPTRCCVETDTTKRDLLIKEAFEIGAKDFGYIPLHQQALAWGVSKKVKLDAARRQSGPALLGDQTGLVRLRHQVPAA